MDFEPVSLPDDMDWIMAPVAAGYCKYESLKDGSLTLCDVAMMNDMIAVRHENEARAAEAAKNKSS